MPPPIHHLAGCGRGIVTGLPPPTTRRYHEADDTSSPHQIAELRPVVRAIAERCCRLHYIRQTNEGPSATVVQPLTEEVLEQHLTGLARIGAHLTAPGDNTVRCAAFDVDGKASETRPARPWSAIQDDMHGLTVGAVREGLAVTWFAYERSQGAQRRDCSGNDPQDAFSVRAMLGGIAECAAWPEAEAGVLLVLSLSRTRRPHGPHGNALSSCG